MIKECFIKRFFFGLVTVGEPGIGYRCWANS